MNKMPETSKIAEAFHQKAIDYDRHVLVQKRVVAELARSVQSHLKQEPSVVLDVGTGTGALLERLHAIYPEARLTGVDIALNMCLRTMEKLGGICQTVNCAAENLPFKDASFDLVVSASMLQWVDDLSSALFEMRRVTKSGGMISLAFFCEGTLEEMQSCFSNAMSNHSTDYSRKASRLHNFHTVDEVKDVLKRLDFESIVMTVEAEVDWYADLNTLLRSIKNIGAGSVSGGSGSGLGWRGIFKEASRLYMERHGVNGLIPATYKVLYLSALVK